MVGPLEFLQEELNAVYKSLVNKQECVLKKMEYQYVDYADLAKECFVQRVN